jgi:hypothetical protein
LPLAGKRDERDYHAPRDDPRATRHRGEPARTGIRTDAADDELGQVPRPGPRRPR